MGAIGLSQRLLGFNQLISKERKVHAKLQTTQSELPKQKTDLWDENPDSI